MDRSVNQLVLLALRHLMKNVASAVLFRHLDRGGAGVLEHSSAFTERRARGLLGEMLITLHEKNA